MRDCFGRILLRSLIELNFLLANFLNVRTSESSDGSHDLGVFFIELC